jgi:LAS superfamily LD-carboxypeptidase LdcB
MSDADQLCFQMVDAAKQAGVKLFIYSGLPNYKQMTGGKVG